MTETTASSHILVITSSNGNITAKKIANELVESGAAACVQVLPKVYSVFRWKNQVDHEEEHLLLIKTIAGKYAAVEKTIKMHHPYEVPEIVSLPIIGGSSEYLDWLSQMVSASNAK